MKDLSVSFLLDIYGCLLGEKQWRMVNDYYNEDLSLSEIAENEGISRQAAHEAIRRAEQQMRSYEEKMQIHAKVTALKEAAAANDPQALINLIDTL